MTDIITPTLRADGNIGREPVYRAGRDGRRSFAAIRLLKSERRRNPETRRWEDTGVTLVVILKAFGPTADLVGRLVADGRLAKGTPVVATGRLDAPETWTDRQGTVHADPVVIIDTIGIDLLRQARADAARARTDTADSAGTGTARPVAGGGYHWDDETADPWTADPEF
ncbi:single-stranded DNA-binding protein [Bifidobacterium margollesii]|uniref:Single-stranded DNA-binding protein n=1 Tax=Bifidobacterium margollesii TaxID=2020964 RepID=A0A2N5J965_9BIFI|nr:single-stranded DNA-binding protein [Bifidobacterium margollesii]PLS30753.1 single-stranded DNA-binding protein [Bifidobacterium margollesii]